MRAVTKKKRQGVKKRKGFGSVRMGGLAALVLTFVGALGCGTLKPPPPSDCVSACAHLGTLRTEGLPADLPADGCGTSQDLCLRMCTPVEPTRPEFPACFNAATSCADANSCQ